MNPIIKSLAGLLVTLLVVSFVIFLVMEAVPGDPAEIILGTSASPDTLEALRNQLGLNQPLITRYICWLTGVLHGDLGNSYTYSTPVAQLIGERLKVTLPLTAMAIVISVAISLPLGVIAASRPNGLIDNFASLFAQIGIAVPNFWIGLLLILGVALYFGALPAGGFPGWNSGLWPGIKALILPSIALAIPQAAVLTRVTRSAVIEVTNEDFVRTARAKGATPSIALWRHVMPNALIPVVTMLGMQISVLIAGAVLVENVFNLPGLGSLAYQALAQRDLIVIQNVVLFFATIVMGVNVLVDAVYTILDPRLRVRK
ncbi:ABC transporter permease [Vibrio salinus]|uniref:ABC transporter permease n=1 Tax=Vibrio salinus TaxID=2899784 RepID=UPI001E4D18E0|nr:ABC transporter permease [Vibrio salinus]MCE0492708.1 ABC transporter permease [Vibrio salinus]